MTVIDKIQNAFKQYIKQFYLEERTGKRGERKYVVHSSNCQYFSKESGEFLGTYWTSKSAAIEAQSRGYKSVKRCSKCCSQWHPL